MNKPRLIDANEALNIIRNGWRNHYSCKDMCDEINNIPTAYDINEVVEQLEECEATCNGRNRSDEYKGCGYESGCAGCVNCKTEDAYRKAIEIVKGGLDGSRNDSTSG